MTYTSRNNLNYHNIFELSKDIFTHKDDFLISFREDPLLMDFIKEQDQAKWQLIKVLLATVQDKDELLFKITYSLNPYLPLTVYDITFPKIRELGNYIIAKAPSIDDEIKSLLVCDLLSFYMRNNGLDKTEPSIFKKVLEYSAQSKKNSNLAYFRFAFFLHGVTNVTYNKTIYNDLDSFIKSHIDLQKMKQLAATFENNCFIYAWQIETTGSTALFDRYQRVVEIFEQKERLFNSELKRIEKSKSEN